MFLLYFDLDILYGNKISSLLLLLTICTDEKLKLWLFLPGRHSTVAEKAQPAVSRLRGINTLHVI